VWLGTTAPAHALSGMESAQEVTLASLGVPGEAATGSPVTLSVAFPPPLGPPAGSGSFVRVFTVQVDGSTVGSVALNGTGSGATIRLSVPGRELHPGRNAVTFGFQLADLGGWARVSPGPHLVLQGPPPGDRAPLAAVRALGVVAIVALLVWQLRLPREVAR
jgi:hypothetical protein